LPPKERLRETHIPDEAEDAVEAAPAAPVVYDHPGDAYQVEYDELFEAAQEEAAQLLADARRQAREIVDQADAQAEKAREEAYAEGFSSGRDDGFNAAVDEAEKAFGVFFDEGQAEIDKVIADAYAERDSLLGEMEPKILRLALDVAEKILGYELDAGNEAFVSLVTTALGVMQQEPRVTLRVSSEQHTGAFHSKASARLKTGRGKVEAEIVADPGMEPNGCLIETGSGTVDASVSSQLEQISRNLGLE
jgi:flagellar assembly protein FliH